MSKQLRIRYSEMLSLIHACGWERSINPGKGSHRKYSHINSNERVVLPTPRSWSDTIPIGMANYMLEQVGIDRERIINSSIKQVIKEEQKRNDTSREFNASEALHSEEKKDGFSQTHLTPKNAKPESVKRQPSSKTARRYKWYG